MCVPEQLHKLFVAMAFDTNQLYSLRALSLTMVNDAKMYAMFYALYVNVANRSKVIKKEN